MRQRIVPVLIALPVFFGAFGTAYVLAAPGGERGPDAAVNAIARDPGHTVCLAGRGCIDPRAQRTLFVFFAPGDCAIGLHQTAALERLFQAVPRARLNVIGVAQGMSRTDALKFARASRISYPIYVDSARLAPVLTNPRLPRGNKPVMLLMRRDGTREALRLSGPTVNDQDTYVRALIAHSSRAP